jgi:hypothetical protein
MLEQTTSLYRLFYDRGSNITASQDPNGMTNGVDVDFVSLEKQSSLTNFTHSLATSKTLPSKVSLFAQSDSTTTAANSSSTTAPTSSKQSAQKSSASTPLVPISLLLLSSLLTLSCLHF